MAPHRQDYGMQLRKLGGTATKNFGACLFALVAALSGCASRPVVDPPSPELRHRMDRVVLRVFADTKPSTHAADTLVVGAEEGSKYAAKNVAKAGAETGFGIMRVGCDPQWRELWFLACPVGLVAGAVVGVGTAVVGGAGAAVYGAAQAPTQDEIDTAVAALDKTLLEMKLADAFREQLISATHTHTGVRIIDDAPRRPAKGQEIEDRTFPIIVATKIDNFTISREGRLTPELSLEISVSTDLFDAPEAGRRYTRSWSFSTTLGDFYTLTDQGGARLRREIDAALKIMAVAVVEDIFLTVEPEPVETGTAAHGVVVNSYGSESPSTREWFREQKQKAACGDAEAQIMLGKAYAAIDPRVYGPWSRAAMIDGYQWLRRAEISGHNDAETTSDLGKLRNHLNSDEVAAAERRVRDWRPAACGAKPVSRTSPSAMAVITDDGS
jgi:hypothetical protein